MLWVVKCKWIGIETDERLDTYYADQPDQFEEFDLVEPQTQQEQQQEQQQQQQQQFENGCFIQQCDQTITGRLLSYSR